MSITRLGFAQMFYNLGISIIPLYHRSKEPILSTWREFQTRLPDENELRQWFATDWNNYGVVCGWCNLVVIDFDNMQWYNIWRLWLSDTQYCSMDFFQVRTRNGMHVYVTTAEPAANDKRIARSGGIDVQAQGKYVVGPLSTHPTGHVYEPIGEMVFPVVRDVESILPLDLFPAVAHEEVVYNGAPVSFECVDTEYLSDPFAAASMDNTDLITKIKRAVRIEHLFPHAIRSSVDGLWLKALCPFHDDHHESFWINTVKQLCGCQVCGMRPMDILNLYARMHNVSESVAVSRLAEEVGIWR